MKQKILYISIIMAGFLVEEGLFAGTQSNKESKRDQNFSNLYQKAPISSVTTNSQAYFNAPLSPQLTGAQGMKGGPSGNNGPRGNYTVIIQEGGFIHHGHMDQGQQGDWHHYTTYVPSDVDSILIHNTGGSGDSDLYTRENGGLPSFSNYDCRPYLYFWPTIGGDEEACLTNNLSSGSEFYHSVHLYDSTSYGSDLTVSYNLPSSNNSDRREGFGWPANSLAYDKIRLVNIDIPEGLKNLVISTSDGSGDPDLFMKAGHNTNVGPDNYTWRGVTEGNDSISLPNPPSGTFTIGLYAYNTISNVHLRVRYDAFDPGAAVSQTTSSAPQYAQYLYNGYWSQQFNDGAARYFYIDVYSNQTWLDVYSVAYEGDADLYVAKDRTPTTKDYDCRSTNSGSMFDGEDDGFGYDDITNERCRLPAEYGRYYIMMRTYKERFYGDAYIMASYSTSPEK